MSMLPPEAQQRLFAAESKPQRRVALADDRLASSKAHVIPGHDPLVLERYPAASKSTAGWIARLDLEPRKS